MENSEKILQVKNLVISFRTDRGIVHAVRGVSFDLYKGETLCIVGESGSGKSVTNKAIMGISANNAIVENGEIIFEGEDLIRVSEEEFHRIRGHKIGMIFQDPLSALNPTMKVGKQITEATLINKNVLKRHYEELIANELVEYRNVESNAKFEIKKLENEEEKNKKLIKKLKKLSKSSKFSSFLLTKLFKKEDSKLHKKSKNKVNSNEEKRKEILEGLDEYFKAMSRFYTNEIVRLSEIKEQILKRSEDENLSELKKRILDNKIKYQDELISIYRDFEGKVYLDDANYKKAVVNRNKDIESLIKFYKKMCKASLPDLKKDLHLRKKEAKKENKEYATNLKNEYHKNLETLIEKEHSVDNSILKLRESLNEEELKTIDEILKENEITQKKIKKLNTGYHETSISKTSKDNLLVIKSTNNEAYDALLKGKEDVKKEIEALKSKYINSTKITKSEAKKMALKVMKEVGIPLPEKRFKQYPFEFSGGMRQRIVIAIALTANPDILICDEPTTALDVTIQAQILDLINNLKKERNLSCIFITHDLGVVAHMADRVAVMYAGKIVEYGKANEIFFEPKHPYTWALLSSIPDIHSKEKLEAIPGTPPDMLYPPKGDAFALRSKYAMAIDFKYEPPFFKISETHYAATRLLYPDAPKVEMPNIVKIRIANALKHNKEANLL